MDRKVFTQVTAKSIQTVVKPLIAPWEYKVLKAISETHRKRALGFELELTSHYSCQVISFSNLFCAVLIIKIGAVEVASSLLHSFRHT